MLLFRPFILGIVALGCAAARSPSYLTTANPELALCSDMSIPNQKPDVHTDDADGSIDAAIEKALPMLFGPKKTDGRDRDTDFVAALTLYIGDGDNVKLISERADANYTTTEAAKETVSGKGVACSVGVFICLRGECFCTGGGNKKRNLTEIPENVTVPFTPDCPRGVSRVCHHGKCYCKSHPKGTKKKRQNINSNAAVGCAVLVCQPRQEAVLVSGVCECRSFAPVNERQEITSNPAAQCGALVLPTPPRWNSRQRFMRVLQFFSPHKEKSQNIAVNPATECGLRVCAPRQGGVLINGVGKCHGFFPPPLEEN